VIPSESTAVTRINIESIQCKADHGGRYSVESRMVVEFGCCFRLIDIRYSRRQHAPQGCIHGPYQARASGVGTRPNRVVLPPPAFLTLQK
jgi:hypothetical protein